MKRQPKTFFNFKPRKERERGTQKDLDGGYQQDDGKMGFKTKSVPGQNPKQKDPGAPKAARDAINRDHIYIFYSKLKIK